jgi:hypothetical protein
MEKTMRSLIQRVLWTGLVSGVASGLAAAALSRVQNGRAAPAINAVSHIAWGGPPPADSGPRGRNFIVGAGLHLGGALFWAAVSESLVGSAVRRTRAMAWLSGSVTAAAAYWIDYNIVPMRLRPGMEAFVSPAAVKTVYAALAAGLAIAPDRRRGLRAQQSNIESGAAPSGALERWSNVQPKSTAESNPSRTA